MSLPLQEFFSYNRSQDFVLLDKFHFLSLFNTCHTVSVLLPFAVQRSTYTQSRACDACVPRSLVSLVIRWCQRIECLSRVCTVFLALFVEFKMGKHKKEIAQHSRLANICIRAKKRQRQLFVAKILQRHLSLAKQATGGLENERQSDIRTPLEGLVSCSC